MTLDDFDTWRVMYSKFVYAYYKYDIYFALINYPEALDSQEVRVAMTENEQWKRPLAHVTLGNLEPGASASGSQTSQTPNSLHATKQR